MISSATADFRLEGIHCNPASNFVDLAYANDTNYIYGVETCTNLTEGNWFRQAEACMVYSEEASNTVVIAAGTGAEFYYRLRRKAVGHSLPQITSQSGWLMRTEHQIAVDDIIDGDLLGNTAHYCVVSNYYIASYVELFQPPIGFVPTWSPADFTIPAGKQFIYCMMGGGNAYMELPFSHVGDWRLTHPTGPAPRTMSVRIEWHAFEYLGTPANAAPDYCAIVTITGPDNYVKRFDPVYNDGHVIWNSEEEPDEPDQLFQAGDDHWKPDDGDYTITIDIKDAPTLSSGTNGLTIGTIEKQIYLYNW